MGSLEDDLEIWMLRLYEEIETAKSKERQYDEKAVKECRSYMDYAKKSMVKDHAKNSLIEQSRYKILEKCINNLWSMRFTTKQLLITEEIQTALSYICHKIEKCGISSIAKEIKSDYLFDTYRHYDMNKLYMDGIETDLIKIYHADEGLIIITGYIRENYLCLKSVDVNSSNIWFVDDLKRLIWAFMFDVDKVIDQKFSRLIRGNGRLKRKQLYSWWDS